MNYQEKVATRAEVRALYERVRSDPAIARYRGYTATKSYGWDAGAGDCIKRDGEVWFDNPGYRPAAKTETESARASEAPEAVPGEAEEMISALQSERDEERKKSELLRAEKAELCLLVEGLNARVQALESDLAAATAARDECECARTALAERMESIRKLTEAAKTAPVPVEVDDLADDTDFTDGDAAPIDPVIP